ncbi:hypothetical protein ACJJTC_019009 [Scirpophaga incertulas]
MERAVVESEQCVCGSRGTLEVLGEVHRAYEHKMALLEARPGADKLQLQLDTFRCWVSDLVGQNTLLAHAVEALETEASSALLAERRRHSEKIHGLTKELQQYEQTIVRLRSEMPTNNHNISSKSTKDAEVMAGMCCTGKECGDWEPVRDPSTALEDVAKYQERMKKMEANLQVRPRYTKPGKSKSTF